MVLNKILTTIFGTKHEKDVKAIQPLVYEVTRLEPAMRKLSDEQLRGKTAEFREKISGMLSSGYDEEQALNALLPEAFAAVREASSRAIGLRPFDVQVIGGIVLHQGKIAEMKTGEGKTLVGTMPVYLNALLGKGVHVVTVNDYLAKRDAEWMGKVYRFMGLTVGCIQQEMDNEERQKQYNCDVTYGQNNEFGFDYLRDNMKYRMEDMVQRPHYFALVDEVDSILIDEARTPLIISGPSEERVDKYYTANGIIPRLQAEKDYTVDEKQRTATLTEEGIARCEQLLNLENLYEPSNIEILHCLQQALVAHKLYSRDVEYMIQEGEVVIVDEFTGRVMPGRRWSDGLHQAIEAKESVKIQQENQTLATITFQNYFRLYKKLAGMTGTADTEAMEFDKIYKLDVVVIPTHRPMVRNDHADMVYRTEDEKWNAAADEIEELNKKGQPVLVGTVSIEKSERMSALLRSEERQARRPQRQVPREGGGDRRAGRKEKRGDHRHQHGRKGNRHPSGRQPGGARQIEGKPRDAARGVRQTARLLQGRLREGTRRGGRTGRASHPRHRKARVEARRPSAEGKGRQAGRQRGLEVLPLAGGRPYEALRRRQAEEHDGQGRHGRGRPDRPPVGLQINRKGAEVGRRPELRNPETSPGVR